MKRFLSFYWFIIFLMTFQNAYSQYSISGYLDSPGKNKRVYLSLLQYDEQNLISKKQILTSTITDSTGYYHIQGKLLSSKHKLYRIHANLEEESLGMDFYNTPERKNYHNFIFSNTDTIVFQKSKKKWFSNSLNSNELDKQWRELSNYERKLRKEFAGTKNIEAKSQYFFQFLYELKTYAQERETHPFVISIILSNLSEDILKEDFKDNSAFYIDLQNKLNTYYSNKSYALQFNDLISSLAISETEKQLIFYKRIVYVSSFLMIALLVTILILSLQLKRLRNRSLKPAPSNLTKQEERVAELIMQEKSNKEIAADLFISLSTVKTHVRNLYAKYEVNSRAGFIEKTKNHPRD